MVFTFSPLDSGVWFHDSGRGMSPLDPLEEGETRIGDRRRRWHDRDLVRWTAGLGRGDNMLLEKS